jgi:hypothetical protein
MRSRGHPRPKRSLAGLAKISAPAAGVGAAKFLLGYFENITRIIPFLKSECVAK